MVIGSARGHGELGELVAELARGMGPDAVEREVARRRPWLDEERLAAVWLLASCLRERPAAGRPRPTV